MVCNGHRLRRSLSRDTSGESGGCRAGVESMIPFAGEVGVETTARRLRMLLTGN
jgi:hypothetical protein